MKKKQLTECSPFLFVKVTLPAANNLASFLFDMMFWNFMFYHKSSFKLNWMFHKANLKAHSFVFLIFIILMNLFICFVRIFH